MTIAVTELEPVIGLEVHCQLLTRSKAFCACPVRFGDAPNTNTCPVCLGLPGALPVFNAAAVDLALRIALATGCTIRRESIFARKNYFYPDLPKGYQISQYEEPLAEHGAVEVELPGGRTKTIRLTRIHLEEDAGKSMHDASDTSSFVDLNRAGTPLVEIVSAPDFRTSEEAHAYLVALRQLVRYLGVSDGNMEQGSLRCDCNVSVRPKGQEKLGTKVELKNLNSFRSVVRALEHEIERQSAMVRRGEAVEHGTRLWDEAKEQTRAMRRKEVAQDYRYVPEPDLLPLAVTDEHVERVRAALPELPRARRERFVGKLGLTPYDAGVLTSSRAVAAYFEDVARLSGDPKRASNWVQGEILRELKERNADLESDDLAFPVTPAQLAELMGLVASGATSISSAKLAFAAMIGTGRGAREVVDEMGLAQVSDEGAIRDAVRAALASNAKAVEDFRAGNPRTFGFLVGQVMKSLKGASPERVNAILREELQR